MMVYDVTNRESFESIENWLKEVNIHAGPDVVKLLVGTKTDKEGRVVATEEGQTLASKMGVRFIEVSAQSGENVEQAFVDLAVEIMRQQVNQPQVRPNMLL